MSRSDRLDRYKRFVGEGLLSQIYHVAESLAGLHVLHVNTTAQGGGVAELLHALIPVMEELGIRHTWKVVPLDEASNRFTASIVDLLQGIEHGKIPEAEERVFLDKLRHTPVLSHAEENQADFYFIHDFQLAPLATFFPRMRPALWMCHVDTANPDPNGKAYIEQFLDAYSVCVFNTPLSVFKDLPPQKTHVITPTIDPFSEKNRFLTLESGMRILARCGIDTTRPLITQVSRFGNWKNPWQVIDVYRLVKQQLPAVQVALVGAMEAADDIHAMEVLKDVQHKAGNDPDIHLLSDPAVIKHPEVNAFQRYSSVILQRSIREGFGLTVTEAMWKYQPVVGTSATGLRTQIIDGQNGYIVDDTETCATYTLKLIQDRELWRKLGRQAHLRVKDNYLLPTMILEYLGALLKARGASSAAGRAQAALDRLASS
ncbi:MAG TPA: glycosyltransferase [Ktedonobacteraceae bacterium]|nr:glycosyltransferase [Ktedonobacteraceae bacterium]